MQRRTRSRTRSQIRGTKCMLGASCRSRNSPELHFNFACGSDVTSMLIAFPQHIQSLASLCTPLIISVDWRRRDSPASRATGLTAADPFGDCNPCRSGQSAQSGGSWLGLSGERGHAFPAALRIETGCKQPRPTSGRAPPTRTTPASCVRCCPVSLRGRREQLLSR